jgi:hypothetical protein
MPRPALRRPSDAPASRPGRPGRAVPPRHQRGAPRPVVTAVHPADVAKVAQAAQAAAASARRVVARHLTKAPATRHKAQVAKLAKAAQAAAPEPDTSLAAKTASRTDMVEVAKVAKVTVPSAFSVAARQLTKAPATGPSGRALAAERAGAAQAPAPQSETRKAAKLAKRCVSAMPQDAGRCRDRCPPPRRAARRQAGDRPTARAAGWAARAGTVATSGATRSSHVANPANPVSARCRVLPRDAVRGRHRADRCAAGRQSARRHDTLVNVPDDHHLGGTRPMAAQT